MRHKNSQSHDNFCALELDSALDWHVRLHTSLPFDEKLQDFDVLWDFTKDLKSTLLHNLILYKELKAFLTPRSDATSGSTAQPQKLRRTALNHASIHEKKTVRSDQFSCFRTEVWLLFLFEIQSLQFDGHPDQLTKRMNQRSGPQADTLFVPLLINFISPKCWFLSIKKQALSFELFRSFEQNAQSRTVSKTVT